MAHATDKKIRELYSYRVSGTHGPTRISVSVHEQRASDSEGWTDLSRWHATIALGSL